MPPAPQRTHPPNPTRGGSAIHPLLVAAIAILYWALLLATPAAGADGDAGADGGDIVKDCDHCDDCPSSATTFLGSTETVIGPSSEEGGPCPEGSVALISSLRTSSSTGPYLLTTSNPTDGLLDDPYVYRDASTPDGDEGETTCFSRLPRRRYGDDEEGDGGGGGMELRPVVVGDQSQLEVEMNCESIVRCDLRWDVRFGCAETGVLLADEFDRGGVQVLSDIDDTIVAPNPQCDSMVSCMAQGTASVKSYLSGVDKRLERGEFYPGVAELMLGLSLGPNDGRRINNTDPTSHYVPPKPKFLSARPREASSILSISQDSDLNLYLERVGRRHSHDHWGANVDSGMYGTLLDGRSFTEFGQTKARHYDDVSGERPNTRFVFLGDNGQGDVCAAQSMLESDVGGDRMEAVLIHLTQNQDDALTDCQSPDGTDFTLNLPEGDRVHYHRTHSDAALWAWERGLISCRSAARVYEAVEEWRTCRCPVTGADDAPGLDGSAGDLAEERASTSSSSNYCPPSLPTGVQETATRDETLSYCVDVGVDQATLMESLKESCDGEHVEVNLVSGGGADDDQDEGSRSRSPFEDNYASSAAVTSLLAASRCAAILMATLLAGAMLA